MLTDPKLRSQVDALWDKFWTGVIQSTGCDWVCGRGGAGRVAAGADGEVHAAGGGAV